MADLTITASQVLPDTSQDIKKGIAAVAITAGQAVCLDTNTSTVKLYDANDTAVNVFQPGIALCSASAGQVVSYQDVPNAFITLGAAAAPVNGTIYVASANAGGIAPAADLASGHLRAIIGVGTTGNRIKTVLLNTGITG